MASAIPEFGERIEGRTYVPRPGAYALITDSRERVCVIQSRGRYFLPGGGIEVGETAEDALQRELHEELGRSSCILARVGEAVQYLTAEGEGCFAIRGTFFRVRLLEGKDDGGTYDEIKWLSVSDAIAQLDRHSDAWAVEQIANLV